MNVYDSMPPRTLADYLAVAVTPILIMFMVGSLNFFLAEVGYRGEFEGQVYWTLFWFTVASVLVSRISIEKGTVYGSVYGLALGAATAFRLVAFVGAPWGAVLLLGMIWWSASKLTWDCTVMDEHADASGQGLVDQLKPPAESAKAKASSDDVLPGDEPKRKPHAPGRWLIYVSLGALPIFGCGQWMIPASDSASRLRAFGWAALFVAAALGLLMMASFAGIRRYLRQRRITMPSAMAGAWVAQGITVALVIYFAAMLLPRPAGLDTWANLGLELRNREQKASNYAMSGGDAAQGEGRRLGRPGKTGEPIRKEAEEDSSEKSGGSESSTTSGGKGQGTDSARERGNSGRSGSTTSLASSNRPSESWFAGFLTLLKGISYLVAILAIAWVIWRFGRPWLGAWKGWRRNRSQVGAPVSAESGPPRRRFADFENPFRGEGLGRMTPDELALYTFEALEAWAADRGRVRRPDQTPLSFGRELEGAMDELAADVRGVVRLYLRAAYGGGGTVVEEVEPMRRLWLALGDSS